MKKIRGLVKEENLLIILRYCFQFLHKNICCVYSLEASLQGASNEYPHRIFLWRTGVNYPRIIIKFFLTSSLNKIIVRQLC